LNEKTTFLVWVKLDPTSTASALIFDPNNTLVVSYQFQTQVQGDCCMFVTDRYEFVPGTYVMLIDPLD